MPFLL